MLVCDGYRTYIQALENRRTFFKDRGATATDHAVLTPFTAELSEKDADAILRAALKGSLAPGDVARFTGHMLMEMARMSIEDGLVMQLHPGSLRNHNAVIRERFGLDKGADIPLAAEYTRHLQPLLNKYGNHPRLTLILFTLDETTYSRELAPIAGHYPAVKLGAPWWFFFASLAAECNTPRSRAGTPRRWSSRGKARFSGFRRSSGMANGRAM